MNLNTQGIKSLFTRPQLGLLIIRASVCAVLINAGFKKFAGGHEQLSIVGQNLSSIGIQVGTDNAVTLFMGIMAAGSQLIGGVLLLIGLFPRIASTFMLFTMLVATATVYHRSSGDIGATMEPGLIALVLLGLLFSGAGRLAIHRD
jgi:putative oxidoreductase